MGFLDSLRCIPDSKAQDSGFHKQNPDSLKRGDTRDGGGGGGGGGRGVRWGLVRAHSLILCCWMHDHDVKFGYGKTAAKTCNMFARLLENELKIDVGESRETFYFSNLYILRILLAKEKLFGSKWPSPLYGVTAAKFCPISIQY